MAQTLLRQDVTAVVEISSTPQTLLPSPFAYTAKPLALITQGAEAVLYRTHFLIPALPCVLKYRPSKPWRHPTLDVRLTRHRILSEARTLVRCKRHGVSVPAVFSLDWDGGDVGGQDGRKSGGWMMMEWIEGDTVRNALNGWIQGEESFVSQKSFDSKNIRLSGSQFQNHGRDATELMTRIGKAVGRMHEIGVVHGDLTTSNLMLRACKRPMPPINGALDISTNARTSLIGEVVLIDFGLATQSVQDEDKAVDLYVLERAFGSTHPTVEGLFAEVLIGYGTSYNGAHVVLKRLEDVRMRGRKRSMLG
ncbi:serine/threonine-protein kinase bud32 [Lambiella insularis]|nr:serine/threonine-protein kinase bud32 [Lambiella insularis]